MDSQGFVYVRKRLSKTQRQMAQLLGISQKAVQGYEQGWRNVPIHVERQILFLAARAGSSGKRTKPCWVTKKCPPQLRNRCPAWELEERQLCWLINGTLCEGDAKKNWNEKMKVCRACEILAPILPPQKAKS